MPAKDQLKSARKKFMVMKTKQTIFSYLQLPDDEVETKLNELKVSLSKVFSEAEAVEIIEKSIGAAETNFDSSLSQIIATSVADKIKEDED